MNTTTRAPGTLPGWLSKSRFVSQAGELPPVPYVHQRRFCGNTPVYRAERVFLVDVIVRFSWLTAVSLCGLSRRVYVVNRSFYLFFSQRDETRADLPTGGRAQGFRV